MADHHTGTTPRLQTTVVDLTRTAVASATEEEHRKRYKRRFVATIATDSPCVSILRDVHRLAPNPYRSPSQTRKLEIQVPELDATIVSAARSRLIESWLEVTAMVNPEQQDRDEELRAPRFAYYTIHLDTLEVYEADD